MRVVNFIIEFPDKQQLNLNTSGLLDVDFNKYKGSELSKGNTILTDISISFYDKTGIDILSKLQSARFDKSVVKFRYGFDDDLSDYYEMIIVNVGVKKQDNGTIITVGGIGNQFNTRFPAEFYKQGTPVREIIKKLASRNNWLLGTKVGDDRFIYDVPESVLIPDPILKLNSETDIDFLRNKIKPILDKTAIDLYTQNTNLDFFVISLVNVSVGGNKRQLALKVEKNKERAVSKNVWTLTYGATPSSNVLSYDLQIDNSFLINGINLVIPNTDSLAFTSKLSDEAYESNVEKVDNIIVDKRELIDAWLKDLVLPITDISLFKFNYEFVDVEGMYDKSLEKVVLDQLQNIFNMVNTLQVDIIGNHRIEQGDIIDFQDIIRVKSKGSKDLYVYTRNPFVSKRWRIVGIKESISYSSGYTTSLLLVQDLSTKLYE